MMRSLRSRLIVGMFLGMAVLLAAAGTTLYTVQRHQLYQAFDETLASSANALALMFRPNPDGGIEFNAERVTRLPAGRIRQGVLFQFWSEQPIHLPASWPASLLEGISTSATQPSFDPGPPPDPPPGWDPYPGPPPEPPRSGPRRPPRRRSPYQDQLIVRSPSLNGEDLPCFDAPSGEVRFASIVLPNGTPGRAVGQRFRVTTMPGPGPQWRSTAELTAVVAASTSDINRNLRFLVLLLAATAVGAMAVCGGVAWLVVTRGLRPLDAVAHKIGTMDELGLKQRLAERDVPREIEPIVSQLNGLLGRLDEAFDRERSLTADVAHELRTPVAEIRTITEITLSRRRDPDEYRQALGDTLESAVSLQGLIEKLLVLARLEAGQMKPELDSIAMSPALAQHWEQVRSTAEDHNLVFENRCPPDTMVIADPKLLNVVLSNALANAVAYTPAGGRITLEARCTNDRCMLQVANTGCQLSADDVHKVFDRFWRADAARANRSSLNCGLGLTLVRRAMEAMGGTAEASMSADRCFLLALTFDADERNE